jgi:hypothetical protein
MRSEDILEHVETGNIKKNWETHRPIERMTPERLLRQAYYQNPAGRCDLSRPRNIWVKQFNYPRKGILPTLCYG